MDEGIFRFISLRPANSRPRAKNHVVLPLDPPPDNSKLGREIKRATDAGARRPLNDGAAAYRSSTAYLQNEQVLPDSYRLLFQWAELHRSELLADIDFDAASQDLFGQSLADLVASSNFKTIIESAESTLFIDTLVPRDTDSKDWLILLIKLLRLLIKAGAAAIDAEMSLGDYVTHSFVVITSKGNAGAAPTQNQTHEQPEPSREPQDKEREREKLADRAKLLEAAQRELLHISSRKDALEVEEKPDDVRVALLERQMSEFQAREGRGAFISAGTATSISGLRLAREAAASISEPTRGVLKELKLDPSEIYPVAVVGRVEEELAHIAQELAVGVEPNHVLLMGGMEISLANLSGMFGPGTSPLPPMTTLSAPGTPSAPSAPSGGAGTIASKFMAGIGDLLLVKQTLKAYELGDFAHVENVLQGELRERDHRRLDEREETTVNETERETEKERDLQSTERNELQNEAQRTVRSQTGLDAGIQISGSYGPAVSFSSNLNASFSSTTEEAQRKASSFSREVTEKTAEKVRERTREQRTIRTLQQIEERNLHKIDNSVAPTGHIRGIYRWLNKIYDAMVLSYGQRMMMEFVIPEPAAYFIYALIENPPQDSSLIKPEPPRLNSFPLTPSMLTRGNYFALLSQYNVTGVNPPPATLKVMSYFDRQDGKERNTFARASKIAIPDGYEAYGFLVSADHAYQGTPSVLKVMAGGQAFTFNGTSGAKAAAFGTAYQGEISVIATCTNGVAFAVGVDVACQLTPEGFAKWQHAVFDAITQAYLQQKQNYDEKIAAMKIQKGIEILGRNPLENRRIERDELKKFIVMMLSGTSSLNFNVFFPGIKEPFMNIVSALSLGSYVRFFENAFEWNNILYVLYSYFWGRKARWVPALSFTDPDPDFAAFLKAGSVRVQLPVRPGFERAIAHFCQFGTIWNGNDPPLFGDDLYVPVIQEITENLGKLDDGVPYPEGSKPWEVKVPTELVLLQNLEEIPGIRDALTGANAVIVNP